MGTRKLGRVLSILACLLGALAFASPASAAQQLVTIDGTSPSVDPSNQNLAGPVHPGMAPHPGKLQINVLLPDGYTPKKRYPMLLLFHGSGERFDSWADPVLGNIMETAKGLDAVVVMPEGA